MEVVAADCDQILGIGTACERRMVMGSGLGHPARIAAIGRSAMRRAVAASGPVQEVHCANLPQHRCQVGDPVDNDVDDLAFLLKTPL